MIRPKAGDPLAKGTNETGLGRESWPRLPGQPECGQPSRSRAHDAMVGVRHICHLQRRGMLSSARVNKYVGVFYNTLQTSDSPRTAPSTDAGKAILTRAAGQAPGVHMRASPASCASGSVGCSARTRRNWSGQRPLSRLSQTALTAKWWWIGPNGAWSDRLEPILQWATDGGRSYCMRDGDPPVGRFRGATLQEPPRDDQALP